MNIRLLQPSDDMGRLTKLIHAAYAMQAARGLRFWGTHQSEEDTATRFALGQGLVAESEDEYIGTITIRTPQPESPVALYRDPHTWSISQFAVAPSFKRMGVGKALHDIAVMHAKRNGGRTLALDTAAPAEDLIAMYRAWGYQFAGEHDWRPQTNYLSVLMCQSARNLVC